VSYAKLLSLFPSRCLHRDSPPAFTFTARTYVLRSTAKLNTCFSQTLPTSTHHSESRINPLVFSLSPIISSLPVSPAVSFSFHLRFRHSNWALLRVPFSVLTSDIHFARVVLEWLKAAACLESLARLRTISLSLAVVHSVDPRRERARAIDIPEKRDGKFSD